MIVDSISRRLMVLLSASLVFLSMVLVPSWAQDGIDDDCYPVPDGGCDEEDLIIDVVDDEQDCLDDDGCEEPEVEPTTLTDDAAASGDTLARSGVSIVLPTVIALALVGTGLLLVRSRRLRGRTTAG